MRRAGRRGFTFIELMTVWAIITILAAILFPVFARAREKSRQVTCLTNLVNIGAALKMYGYEHFGHLPPTDNDLRPLVTRSIYDPEVLLCPSARRKQGRLHIPEGNPELVSDYVYRGGLCDDDHPTQAIAADEVAALHNSGANYLFLDGHAKWMSAGSLSEHPEIEGVTELDALRREEDRASEAVFHSPEWPRL